MACFSPTIVASGHEIGTWKRAGTTKKLKIEPFPFATFDATQRKGFGGAVKSYGQFLGSGADVDL
jgi:hypothetical protein